MTTVHAPRERLSTEDAKRVVLEHIGPHHDVEDCLRMAGRTRRCYESWRSSDSEFRADVDYFRAWRTRLLELNPDGTADMAQIEAWRSEFDAAPGAAESSEPPPAAAQPAPPLPTGTCHACNRVALLVRGPRGDLRCTECAGASVQHVQPPVSADA